MATTAEIREAAAILRRLLEQVASGAVEAKGTAGAIVTRRIEGAAAALEAVVGRGKP